MNQIAPAHSGQHALVATVWLHGHPAQELRVPAGRSLVVGPRGGLITPCPEGAPWVVRADWVGRDRLRLRDGRGVEHPLAPGEEVTFGLGDVRVALRIVPDAPLRRTTPVAWAASASWLVAVMATSLLVAQGEVVMRNRCLWFGIDCPPPQQGLLGAEELGMLTRLLQQDVDGEDRGVITVPPPRPLHEQTLPQRYMPAGDQGPLDQEGGANQVAPEPVRTPPGGRSRKAARPTEIDAGQAVDVGTPIPERTEAPDPDPQPAPDAVDVDEQDGDGSAERAEETRGWGMRDWIDASPEQAERMEQELLRDLAEQRLRLDPSDPLALSILARYHYLSENLDKAESFYDRLLEVAPEDAATFNNKALVYKRRGLYAEEEGLYRVALSLDPGDTTALNNLAVNLAHQGRFDEALAIMDELETVLPDDPYSDLHRAKIHAAMGQEARALAFLEQALAGMARLDTLHHIEFRQDIRVDPSFASLRRTPEFRAILTKYYGNDSPLGGAR